MLHLSHAAGANVICGCCCAEICLACSLCACVYEAARAGLSLQEYAISLDSPMLSSETYHPQLSSVAVTTSTMLLQCSVACT